VVIDPSIDGGVDIDPALECEIALLQFLSEHYVFNNSALLAQQQGHRKIVEELFEILLAATEEEADTRGILPTPFDEKAKRLHEDNLGYDDIDTETLRARIVADIIASMTEQQAMELYERVTGSSPGLVTDQIV
jgi:dGTPase